MSSSRRLAVKIAVLVAPVVALSAGIGLGGTALRSASLRLFGPPGHAFGASNAEFVVPDRTWAEPISRFYDDYRERFGKSHPFGKALSPLNKKLTILVTTSRRAFEEVARSETGARLEYNSGYFTANKARIIVEVTNLEKDPPRALEEAKISLSHELVHAILHYSAPEAQWSPWLSEGVAQWGETSTPDRALGALNVDRLKSADLRPGLLKELLVVSQDKFSGVDNLRYYYAAYALVAFLLDKESGYRPSFIAYFAEEAKALPLNSPARFRELVGEIDEVETKWIAWVKQQQTR